VKRLVAAAILILLVTEPVILAGGAPSINITYPAGGSMFTNRTVNVTGTAVGTEGRWVQTSQRDFDNGTYDNTTYNSSEGLRLESAIYDDFNNNFLDKNKWNGPNETGGLISSESDGFFKINGTCNTTTKFASCKINSTKIFDNFASLGICVGELAG
jgi:hypothetical protein